MNLTTASANEINQLREKGATIVDIREKDEFRREHIPDAISLPLSEILSGKTLEPASSPIIFHCQAGSRTSQNCQTLAQAIPSGEFLLLEGGINAWKQAGFPVITDTRQPLPLMRQVQMTAGTLILAGVIAGYSVNSGFFLLSGFVGAGLLFAGVSGWCGMANLLAKMPWNRQ